MSYAKMLYYTFEPGYNDGAVDPDGTIDADVCTGVFDSLIAKRLPSCMDWCGDEVIGPAEPDETERAELDSFPGFSRIIEQAWNEYCQLSGDDIRRLYEE